VASVRGDSLGKRGPFRFVKRFAAAHEVHRARGGQAIERVMPRITQGATHHQLTEQRADQAAQQRFLARPGPGSSSGT
jgi:hypothetical protein